MSVVPSIVLVRSPLLGLDLEFALLERCCVLSVDPGSLSQAWLFQAKRDGALGVVTVNHSPDVAFLCREAGLRYVSWTIDPLSRTRWQLVPGADTVLFVHRKALIAPLEAMGHAQVSWLPLAAPERRWELPEQPARMGPPSFVGSSLQDERRIFQQSFEEWGLGGTIETLDAQLVELCALARADRSFHGFFRSPASVPSSLVNHLAGVASREDIAEVLDAALAWIYRRQEVCWWASRGVRVFGDGGWQDVVGAAWERPLRNGQEMTQTYRDALVSVDVPRLHQREIATLRSFDVMASGGVLLVEDGTELEELFQPGEEFLVWKDPDRREEILEEILHHGELRERIGGAAREAARDHRLGLRAAKILSVLL